MARLPNFLVIIRSEKLSGKGQGRGVGVRKKERFVLGKRTFRSQKSKHFVLRIIDVSISCLWAKESLRFEKKTIYELTGYLSEWYGMDIRLDPSLPTDQAYTFTITHESLEEVLCLIAKITPIEYVFDEDNTVRITRK